MTEIREVFRHLRILRHTLNIVIPVFFCAMGMMHAQNNARARDLGIPFDGTSVIYERASFPSPRKNAGITMLVC